MLDPRPTLPPDPPRVPSPHYLRSLALRTARDCEEYRAEVSRYLFEQLIVNPRSYGFSLVVILHFRGKALTL